MGREREAATIFQNLLARNPDNDEYYLSLALAQLKAGDVGVAEVTLRKGLARIPNSGNVLWGLGVVSVIKGDNKQAERFLRQSVELMPLWQGSYTALAFFYYTTGQISKARDTAERFALQNPSAPSTIQRIQQALDAASPEEPTGGARVLSPEARQEFLQVAFALADTTQ
jgi:Flp pilus assembly protein TadD